MATKKNNDSFLIGCGIGILGLVTSYFALYVLRKLAINYTGNENAFAAPRIQLIAIVINILILRLFMVTFQHERTGKGILFATVILSLVYFYLFFRVYSHE